MDQELIRLVDLNYLLILFAQCQMRKPKLIVYDLLQMKMEKLEDEFANQCINECYDYCQNHASDWGNIWHFYAYYFTIGPLCFGTSFTFHTSIAYNNIIFL